MISQDEVVALIQKAQQALPPEKQRSFVESVAARVGGLLKDNKKAMIGAGIGWAVGELLDSLPVVGWMTGDHASTVGAAIGAYVGHGKDVKDREAREKIGQVIAEELEKARRFA